METIFEIAQGISQKSGAGKANKYSTSIVDGLTPVPTPRRTGIVELTREQALSIRVERVNFNDATVGGYQRPRTNLKKVWQISDMITRGGYVPKVELGLDGGFLYAVDGHHRILGHIIAGKPFLADVTPMTYAQRVEAFAVQRFQSKISADNLVLAADDKVSAYVRDAIENPDNPFHSLIGFTSSATKISPGMGWSIMARYSAKIVGSSISIGSHHAFTQSLRSLSNKDVATDCEELARLLACLGSKRANPIAFKPAALGSILDLAVVAIARKPQPHEYLVKRWISHMPAFPWKEHAHLAARSGELRAPLVHHWNKRLSEANKVTM
jgi:hypothetical protein